MYKQLLLLALIAVSLSCCKSSRTPTEVIEQNHTAPSAIVEPSEKSDSYQPEMPAPLEDAVWTQYKEENLPDLEKRIQPAEFELWLCDYSKLTKLVDELPTELLLPFKEGLQLFRLDNSGTMSPALAEKFPEIKSMKGQSADATIQARVDTNEEGLFVEYKQNDKTYVLSPYLKGSKAYYAFYSKENAEKQPRDEDFD